MEYPIAQESYNLLWTDHALTVKDIRAEQPTTRINHIPEITQITRKNKMAINLNALKNYFPKVDIILSRTITSILKHGCCRTITKN
jgi:hypothetical protein